MSCKIIHTHKITNMSRCLVEQHYSPGWLWHICQSECPQSVPKGSRTWVRGACVCGGVLVAAQNRFFCSVCLEWYRRIFRAGIPERLSGEPAAANLPHRKETIRNWCNSGHVVEPIFVPALAAMKEARYKPSGNNSGKSENVEIAWPKMIVA